MNLEVKVGFLESEDKISVISTIYKHKQKLSQALDSILNQTFKNIEIILVDNNALPETLMVAKEYRDRYPTIVRIVSEPTQGIASARNRGVRESTGDFITFCDEDDIWMPDKLLKQLNVQKKHPEYSIVTNLVDFISYEDGRVVESRKTFSPQFWATELLGKTEHYQKYPLYNPHPSTMFFRKSLALEVGLFDEGFNPYWTEDTEFSLRMYEKGPIYLIPESLTQIRLSSKEYLKTRQGDFDWVAIKNLNYFFSILCKKFGSDKDPVSRKALKKIRAQWMRELSVKFLVYQEGKSYARELLTRALADQPFNLKTWKIYLRTFFPQKYYPSFFHFEKIVKGSLPMKVDESLLKNLFTLD